MPQVNIKRMTRPEDSASVSSQGTDSLPQQQQKARIYSQKNACMLRPSSLSLEFEEVHGPLVTAPPKPIHGPLVKNSCYNVVG